MRVKITNRSRAEDSFVIPLIEFAARQFASTPSKVHATFSATRNGKAWGGLCIGRTNANVFIRSTLDEKHRIFPYKTAKLGYWRANEIPIEPYEYHSPADVIVHVAAHEFAHCMKAGHYRRHSRREVFSENKATEVLAAYRSPEGQAWVSARRAELEAKAAPKAKPSADEKIAKELESITARLKKWESKAKRAATAIKKLARRRKHLEKKTLAAADAMT